jgi:hypothetical protein
LARRRGLLVLAAIVAAFALPTAALAASSAGVNRGVVQSVDATHIVVRALDGSVVTFDLSPKLVVRVNGGPASIVDVTPGVVADVGVDPKGRAALIRVFGAQAPVTEKGIVTAVSKTSLMIATPGGPRTIALDRNTRFKVQGGPGKRFGVRVGVVVAVTHAPDGPAQVVNVVKRAGA